MTDSRNAPLPPQPDPAAIPVKQSLCGMPFGFALHDASFRYVYINEALARINGRSVEAHAGRHASEILPPPIAEAVLVRMAQARQTRQPVLGADIRGVVNPERGERTFETMYYPVWGAGADPAGEPTNVAAVVRDVTDERAMRERLDLLWSMIQGGTDALYVLRPDQGYRFAFVNRATERHYGRSARELYELTVPDLDPATSVAQLDAIWARMQVEGPVELETVHRTPAGDIPVWITAGPVWHGGVGYIAGSIRSLVAERRAEQEKAQLRAQLEHAQRLEAVGLLAGGVAHDFNNLLAVVLANVELLAEEVREPGARQALDAIRGVTRRASDLTRQLLTFSRREAGPRSPESLNAVVTDSLRLVRGAFGEAIEVRTELAPDLPPVVARPAELAQVVMNLLVNARDAMPVGGCLTLGTQLLPARPGECAEVELVVADTGIGMDDATRRRIFEPFFTTKTPATTGTGSGSGLGLSVVYGIVTQLGGRIAVESAPGAGATFRVTFPACEQAAPRAAAPDASPPAPGAGQLLLVVEDEPELRHALERMLGRLGYRTVAAADGVEALGRLREAAEPVAAAITDLRMPRMPGDEFAAFARQLRPELPVLFISGQAEDSAVRGSRLAGERVLAKPFTVAELASAVEGLLRG